MPEPAQGATQQTAQTGAPGEQATGQQTQQTQTAATTEATATQQQTQAQPSVEELTQQLTQLREQNANLDRSYRHFQSLADRAQQQLKAVVGVPQAPTDPLAEKVKYFTDRNIDPEHGKIIAGFVHSELSTLQQQNQALQATLQATTRVGDVMNAVMQDKEYSGAFADPQVAHEVMSGLQQAALGGQANLVSPEYAKELAALAWAHKSKPWNQGQQQTQQVQRPQFIPAFSLVGQPGGYQPAPVQQQQRQTDPAVEQLAARMAQHTGIPLQPKQ